MRTRIVAVALTVVALLFVVKLCADLSSGQWRAGEPFAVAGVCLLAAWRWVAVTQERHRR